MYSDKKIGEQVFPYYVKLEVFKYIDAFIHSSLRETVLDGIVHIQQKFKLSLHSWIVLPGSIRMVLSNNEDQRMMEEVVDSFMNYTDKKLMQNVNNLRNEIKRRWMIQLFESNRRSQRILFWHSRYTLEPLHTTEQFSTCLHDMHEAPVLSGLVWDAQHYMYSSAIDYILNEPGLIPVTRLQPIDSLSL